MKKIILLITSLFFAVPVIADHGPALLRQPVRIPFDATVVGSAVEFHLNASETAKYTSVIGFRLSLGVPEGALWKIGERTTGKIDDPVLELPVHLLITRLSDGKIFTDKMLQREELQSSNRKELNFIIDEIRLEPGEYKVQLYVLHGMGRYKGVDANFGIYIRRL